MGVSLVAGAVLFVWFPRTIRFQKLGDLVMIFDGAGLALFAVVGTQKALGYGLHPVMAPLLGMLTGIGGGMLRDVLVSQIPTVLRAELYAVAALAGASAVVLGHILNLPPTVSAIVGAAICFGIRLVAIYRGWRLPVAALPTPDPPA